MLLLLLLSLLLSIIDCKHFGRFNEDEQLVFCPVKILTILCFNEEEEEGLTSSSASKEGEDDGFIAIIDSSVCVMG